MSVEPVVAAAGRERIEALDVLRGVAVMGILVANLPAFALPEAAYFSPASYGGTAPTDIAAWLATFILVEGKMRGLFSLLFGASMLLVIERAEAAGRSGAAVHYRRMAWLFVIGCAHLYLVWDGDILSHYAIVGAIAYPFARRSARWLVIAAAVLIVWQTAIGLGLYEAILAAQAKPVAGNARLLASMDMAFGRPPPARIVAELTAMRGSYGDNLAWRIDNAVNPLRGTLSIGPETLGSVFLGMAGLRSGFLTGRCERRRYIRWAVAALGIALPVYALTAWHTLAHGFNTADVVLGAVTIAAPARSLAMLGFAAVVILAMRPTGWLTIRIAAAGRTAFTNYLGTSIAMTTMFYGFGLGLFGTLSRGALYPLILVAWAAMLAWSRPWLAAYRYGPFEWLWRSLARWRVEPMRLCRPDDR